MTREQLEAVIRQQLARVSATWQDSHDMRTEIMNRATLTILKAADECRRTRSMMDVIHDPATDWCACQPLSGNRCAYRLLADAIIEHLNPPDGDEAEEGICVTAVESIAAYVEGLECYCAPGYDGTPCGRCDALGQWHGKAVTR